MSARARAGAAGNTGLHLVLLSLAIGLAAVNTGNNLLYLMLSLTLALPAVAAAAARWSLRRLRLEARLPEEAVCGRAALVGVELHGRFPLLPRAWVQVRLEGLPRPVDLAVAVEAGSGGGVASRRVRFTRRGVHDQIAVTAATGYPIGLWAHTTRRRLRTDLIVLPAFARLRRLRVPAAGGAWRELAGEASRRPGGTGGDLHDLRRYTPGDDARRIDWRSSARTGRLMVREREAEPPIRLDLILDREAPSPAAFEPVAARCAAILDLARRAGFEARLIVGREARPLTGRAAMRYVAGAAPVPPGSGAAPPSASSSRARPHTAVVVLSADAARATPIEVA